VQVAKHAGARVTGVCGPGNVAFVRDLGADDVVDYRREDFTRRGERYDVVFDAASASSYLRCRPLLTATGIYLSTSGNAAAVVGTMAGGVIARLTSRQRAVGFMIRAGSALWQRLARLAAAGVLVPHVARAIAIDEVADAQRAMETGHGRGKIVVRLAAD
jgi:NADPH:quinone reductase-like Zn-dependent oxidoreductase